MVKQSQRVRNTDKVGTETWNAVWAQKHGMQGGCILRVPGGHGRARPPQHRQWDVTLGMLKKMAGGPQSNM